MKVPQIRNKGLSSKSSSFNANSARPIRENRKHKRDRSISNQLAGDPAAEASVLYHENMYFRDKNNAYTQHQPKPININRKAR